MSVYYLFLQYFDAVGWVFWPVKTVSHITYTVLAGVSVNTTSAPSATCLCRLPQPPARNWPSMYSFILSTEMIWPIVIWALLWLRDRILKWVVVWSLLVVAVVFLYQITVFLQQNITASLLELYFNDSMQTVRARRRRQWQSRKRGRRWGRCSIYRHCVGRDVKHCSIQSSPPVTVPSFHWRSSNCTDSRFSAVLAIYHIFRISDILAFFCSEIIIINVKYMYSCWAWINH